jgi:ParB family chromosome partitioning protein
LALPELMRNAIKQGKITEGHARPLLMLGDRPEEQDTLFKEIIFKKLTVRESEKISRSIAVEKVRKQRLSPEFLDLEQQLSDKLGTRVRIEKAENGGKVVIDFFSDEDAHNLLSIMSDSITRPLPETNEVTSEAPEEMNDIPKVEEEEKQEDPDLYSVSNFSL